MFPSDKKRTISLSCDNIASPVIAGGPNSDEGTDTLVLYVYMYTLYLTEQFGGFAQERVLFCGRGHPLNAPW